jgi:uncharacterized protein YdiU (UPF0061 family)
MELLNGFARLPEQFYEQIDPEPVSAPRLLLWNDALAEELSLSDDDVGDDERRARIFGGNERLGDSRSLALAYAGHQFGNFVPALGDGRAHWLGEVRDAAGQRREIQLKGSGPTRFSRGGDGRSALGPALREFLMSEAMHGFAIPTTRSLAVVATGDMVLRNPPQPGGIVARVAASHLRVGSFQYFAAQRDYRSVQTLLDYAIERHDPDIEAEATDDRALAFLDRVIDRQIATVMEWMRVGFIHGVMNTDNTTISGETIDFGPCAMMNAYDPMTVFSSIDMRGRYAYGNQPAIIAWNMVRLAECFLPLIHPDEDEAIARVQPQLEKMPSRLEEAWTAMMGRKLGLESAGASDRPLISDLLDQLKEQELDYTVTFDRLGALLEDPTQATPLRESLGEWIDRWLARIDQEPSASEALERMRPANPVVIPRNHHVEAALSAAVDEGDLAPARRLVEVLRAPYSVGPDTSDYQDPPAGGDGNYQTFCGT